MRKGLSKKNSVLFLLLMSILLMGIGYAVINTITGEITGTILAELQKDVFITNIECVSNVDADLTTSEIKYYKGTFMNSTIKLSETNPNSSITYKVTVYNNSENSYPFLQVLYDEEFYDNPDITFEISGFNIGDIINGKETKDIYITFKYKDGVVPENKTLNSNLNFKIAEPNRMVLAQSGEATSSYLGSTVTKETIEKISFKLGKTQPQGTVASFDASEKNDESIMGYYTDTDGNGLYELTFASDELIFANENAQYLFQNLTNLEEITFDNFSTNGVTNMSNMFAGCSNLTSLEVSGFNTSQVTNMVTMFRDCSSLTNLDISGFDTSQVTSMSGMFQGCIGLTTLDVTNFNTSKVTSMAGMFFDCSGLTTLDVRNFDTSQVTLLNNMFQGCIGLTTLDVTNFNISQVTNMSNMFNGCRNLTSLDVSGFDTSQATNMSYMFNCCSSLTTLDVSGFDTSQVTEMKQMFYGCSNLITIFASEAWTTLAVTSSENMFTGSTKIVGGKGTTYDSNYIDATYARIDKTGTPGYLTNIDGNGEKPSVIFDNDGTNTDGLHIGDFINYDAGTWKKDEISAIKAGAKSSLVTANGSTSTPTTAYQFGGFTAGSSRNGNATPYSSTYNYIKDVSTGNAVTGWRVFDIEGDQITLISAGNPENYYHPSGSSEGPRSDYILTGTVKTNVDNYQKRNWDNYINTSQGATSVTTLTTSRLNEWYNKYITENADISTSETFQKIYSEPYIRYQNIIDNYSYYWLSDCNTTNSNYLNYIYGKNVNNSYKKGYGLRMLITLSPNILLEKTGTKTLSGGNMTSNGGKQTYNVWDIENIDIKNPEIKYNYCEKNMDQEIKSVKVLFSAIDENFKESTLTIEDLEILVDGIEPNWTTVTKEFISVTDLTETINGTEKVIGKRYTLLLRNLEQNATSNSLEITIPKGKIRDERGNVNYTHTITIGMGTDDATYKRPSEIYDVDETNVDGLHIGDFINYDAGTWTQEEIDAIKTGAKSSLVTANGSTGAPSTAYQFGGFIAGSSRNGNANPNDKKYHYIKDTSTGNAVTGWRVFDIEGDTITLISAGNPENYYHPSEGTAGGLRSDYILTGTVKTNVDNYQKRNWDNYINTSQGATSVTTLTTSRLNEWYSKYITENADILTNETFQKIYSEPYIRYQNIIDNYSYYWLSDSNTTNSNYLNCIRISGRYYEVYVENEYTKGYGLRILITLSPNILLEKTGTKTLYGGHIDSNGGRQTYNIWNIENVDLTSPQIKYNYCEKNIDQEIKSVKVIFSTIDENFKESTLTVEDLEILVDGVEPDWTTVTKEFVNITDLIETISGTEKVIGKRYTLLLGNLQTNLENSSLTITIPAGKIKDETVNTNHKHTITIGMGTDDATYKRPSEIYDVDETNVDGLHIGDFINYDAGTWTQEEIDAIKTGDKSSLVTANGSTGAPSTAYQFGGFIAGSSRNGNANPNDTKYHYIKDTSTGNAVTGWRVFDIEGDTITLISAGNPENYYHPSVGSEGGRRSEYILTGTVKTNVDNYQKRNWDNYINTSQGATSVTTLTTSRLNEWYSKYITENADILTNETFQKIYSEPYIRYQNIIDNYSYYWLSDCSTISSNYLNCIRISDRYYDVYVKNEYTKGYGLRILITLSPNILLEKTGTKTLYGGHIDSNGGRQTYNTWNILLNN